MKSAGMTPEGRYIPKAEKTNPVSHGQVRLRATFCNHQERNKTMGMKQVMQLRHRTHDGVVQVFLSRGPHRGWVNRGFLIGWLKRHGLWRDDQSLV